MSEGQERDTQEPAELAEGLLRRVARGDRKAFESLYGATSAQLFGVCMRVLRDRSEAEEVLQEVYVAVWEKAAQFDHRRARAGAWMAAIARHRAIDRLRASPLVASRAPIDLAETLQDPDPQPDAHAAAEGDRARLDDCLEQLEPRRMQLIRTAFFDGATYEQLAERSSSPLGSVKSWIRRGLMQLRTCLEQ